MADEFAIEIIEDAPSHADVDMAEDPGAPSGVATNEGSATRANTTRSSEMPFADGGENEDVKPRVQFLSYLTSPVVTLLVGGTVGASSALVDEVDGPAETILTAHQALLTQSPYFAAACKEFADDGSPRQIELLGENIDAVGCFLEYLYTGEYFPRKVPGHRALEPDPSIPAVDETGEQLLRHARVYTLAEKFSLPQLKSLASSKIHCVDSTAKGEIAYARYVYANTGTADTTIRAPVANFWATRSHTLRSEAESEFRDMCLEFPQFVYDVLTRVLDEKLRREKTDKLHPTPGSSRKRARQSNV